MSELQECEGWGDTPICEASYFIIAGTPPEGIRSVSWFMGETWGQPYPAPGQNVRTVDPFPMAVRSDGKSAMRVNLTRFGRGGGMAMAFVSARAVSAKGGIIEMKAKFTWQLGLVRDVSICDQAAEQGGAIPEGCTGSGISRGVPPRGCPNPPSSIPPCRFTGVSTFQASSYSALQSRIEQQCDNSVLIVSGSGFMGGGGPLRIMRRNVTISASNPITISYMAVNAAGTGAMCMLNVYGDRVTLLNIGVTGAGSLCVCRGAKDVRINGARLNGRFANMLVDQGAEVSVLSTLSCGGAMETYCLMNLGNIKLIRDARFAAGDKGGAILNWGTIGTLTRSTFERMNGAGAGTCVTGAGIIITTQGSTIGTITNCSFSAIIDARAIWNDGRILGGIMYNTFSNLQYGAIANGPPGVISDIAHNRMTGLGSSENGAGILNYGLIKGRIEYNYFAGARSGNSGGVIAVVADIGELESCGAAGPAAMIRIGIMDNVFDGYASGDACGAVYITNNSVVGWNWDKIWRDIKSPDWLPPTKRSELTGVVRNIFRNGVASDSGVGMCARGPVSMVYMNTFQNMQTSDSGGAIDIAAIVPFVGYNSMSGLQVADTGGGIYCTNSGFTADGFEKLASVRLVKGNAILGVSGMLEGGCMYIDNTCGISFLVGNKCTTSGGTGMAFTFARPQYPGDRSATICYSHGNNVNGQVRSLGSVGVQSSRACPVSPTGLWYRPEPNTGRRRLEAKGSRVKQLTDGKARRMLAV